MGREQTDGGAGLPSWRRVVGLPPGPEFLTGFAEVLASVDGDLQRLPHAARVQLAAGMHRMTAHAAFLREQLTVATALGFERDPVPGLADPAAALQGLDERARRRLRRVVRRSRSEPGADTEAVRTQVAEDCAVSEIALACGVSDATVRGWHENGQALASGRLPVAASLAAEGRLDRGKLNALVQLTRPLEDAAAVRVDTLVTHRGAAPAPADPFDPDRPADQTQVRATTAFEKHVLAAVSAVDPDGVAARRADRERDRRVQVRPLDEILSRITWILPHHQAAQVAAAIDAGVTGTVTDPATGDRYRDHGDVRSIDELRSDVLFDLVTGVGSDPDDEAADAERGPSSRSGGRRAQVRIVVHAKAGSLFGGDPDPGWSPGVGPVARDVLRELAADADWRCAVTDDTHGTVLGLGRSTFTPSRRPTAALRRLLEHLQPTCCSPGCGVRAQRCDLDHRVPAPGGPTCECNLRPLCRRHHWLKTHAGFQVALSADPRDPPGTLVWTTPAAGRYKTRPFTLDTGLERALDVDGPAAVHRTAERDRPPPF